MHKHWFFVLILLFVLSCSDDPTSIKDTEKPSISLLYPANYSEFDEGTLVIIEADASDNKGIKEVKIYIDGNVEDTDNTEPYRYEWNTNGKSGSHTIKAIAHDESGNIGESDIINVKIIPNNPPIASFTIKPTSGTTFTNFLFNASSSSDYEDATSTLQVRWDFENGGTWDTDYSTSKLVYHHYSTAGTKTVKLEVKDTGGLTNIATQQIKVTGFETGTLTDIDGNVYKTVKIGDQWWMAENLKVTRYRNGDSILNVTDDTKWKYNRTTGAYCAYNNDNGNVNTYGLLYNWYAVDDNRKIAPAGWHVPTDDEWKELEMYLGMSQNEADNTGLRGTDEGNKLKATSGWISGGSGTNESGFTALPGGYRGFLGREFRNIGYAGYWWSATAFYSELYKDRAWYRYLNSNSAVLRRIWSRPRGCSVRLVRD